jgi:hypothetical protein
MRSPVANSELLRIWEQGSRLHPLDRGLLALSAALPDVAGHTLADWTLGRRNRALVEAHACWFGPKLVGWLACARCAEKMEFELDSNALAVAEVDGESSEPATIIVNGRLFRLPTSRDVASVAQEHDPRSAAALLLERCLVERGATTGWSNQDVEEVGQEMARADPMAEIRISLKCPSCGHESSEVLDLAAYLWEEIEGRARQLLFEIHAIARAYGWTEKEILALSDVRRSSYVEMVQA